MGEHAPPVNDTALGRVLKRSLTMKRGWYYERDDWDEHAQALIDAYDGLVALRDGMLDDLAGASSGLKAAFNTLTKTMDTLERASVTNTTKARNDHQILVDAQVQEAVRIRDAIAAEQRETARLVTEDLKTVTEHEVALGKLRTLALGPSAPENLGKAADGVAKVLGEMRARLQQPKAQPLSDGQKREVFERQFAKLKETFESLARAYAAEQQRLEDEAEKAAEQQKLAAWAKAVKDAAAVADFWAGCKDRPSPIRDAWIANQEPFGPDLKALTLEIRKVRAVGPAVIGDAGALALAVAEIKRLGGLIGTRANAINATIDRNIAAAAAQLTAAIKPVGTQPKVSQARDAAEANNIPGLVQEVIAAYEDLNFDTKPQEELRDARAASAAGEANKWNSVGAWMRAVGLGGTPRTGPSGSLYIGHRTDRIDGTTTHFSQFAANAALPADGLNATTADAMAALFGDAVGAMGPHLTLELDANYGSPDNARLFKGSGTFRPGAIPSGEQGGVRGKMHTALTDEVARIEAALLKLLKK